MTHIQMSRKGGKAKSERKRQASARNARKAREAKALKRAK